MSAPVREPHGPPPVTDRRPVDETYHGVTVADPYRWLENGGDAEVRAWIDAQNAHARRHLDAWPGRDELRARLTELMTGGSPSYALLRRAGPTLFAIKRQPPLEQPILVALRSADDPASERVLLDPNRLDPSGGTSIDWYVPSLDGTKVAVSLSKAGTESGDVHVLHATTGDPLGEVVPRVNGGTAGGSLAWGADGTGFFYTRYPRPGERPESELSFWTWVHWHALGTDPESDRYEIGREFPRIAEVKLESSADGRHVLATVQNGDGGEFRHWLRGADGRWRPITSYDDRCSSARLGGGAVWLVSTREAPNGRVVALACDEADRGIASARVVVPEGEDPIETSFARDRGLWVGTDRLYVLLQKGGPNGVAVHDHAGRFLGLLPSPPLSAVDDIVPLDGGALFLTQSATAPPAWWTLTAEGGAPTALRERSPADYSDCEVVRDTAVSKDGTRVPISILGRREDLAAGSRPTILYGYGGYGICQTPIFRARLRAWVERGGLFAVAHIRGGGERGERWRREGNLEKKQNVFDDFAACAERLVATSRTRPDRLALMGASNGGLLMGAMITQHPSLARAVVSLVGVYDMLRVETSPNGAFNVTEFGTVADREQFRALHAYSPYHRVVDGAAYPAVLLTTGENDPRVDPWQTRKMGARLQAASRSGLPVLLRTNAHAGHGLDTALSHQIEEFLDVLTFLFQQLG